MNKLYNDIYELRKYVAILLKRTCATKCHLFTSNVKGLYRKNYLYHLKDCNSIFSYYDYESRFNKVDNEESPARIVNKYIITLAEFSDIDRLYSNLYMLYYALNSDIKEFPNIKDEIDYKQSHSDIQVLANCFATSILIQEQMFNIQKWRATELERFKTYREMGQEMHLNDNIISWTIYFYEYTPTYTFKKRSLFSKILDIFHDKKLKG